MRFHDERKRCADDTGRLFVTVTVTVKVTVTVMVTGYSFKQRILKENEQPIPTLFHLASQRRPNRGHWYQRPGAPLLSLVGRERNRAELISVLI